MTRRPLNLAIVGAGWAGCRQVRAAQEVSDRIRIHALVDSDRDHLEGQADELGIALRFETLEQVLEEPQVDAVSICTPHHRHHPQTLAALDAGKHVLVEKPMADSVMQADEMVLRAAERELCLFVAENQVYEPRERWLQTLVTEERLGEIVAAQVVAGFRAPDYGYPGRRAWLASAQAGGTWTLHGIHTVASIRSILCPVYGEVQSVSASEHKGKSFLRRDLEGTFTVLLKLESGLAVSIIQSAEIDLKNGLAAITLYGEEGSVRARPDEYQLFNRPDHGQSTAPKSYPQSALSSYARELLAFADTIEGGHGPTDGVWERWSLAVVEAGYESAATGKTFNLK